MNAMSLLKGIIGFVMDMLETIVFVGAMFIVVNYYILQPSQVTVAPYSHSPRQRSHICKQSNLQASQATAR